MGCKYDLPGDPSKALERLVAYYMAETPLFWRGRWDQLSSRLTAREALQHIFVYGACFDFSAEVSNMTGWPVREFHWGTPDDGSDDPEIIIKGIHRVIHHPDGFLFDALGRITKDEIHRRFGRTAEQTMEWDGEVDGDFFLAPPESEVRVAVHEILQKLGIKF